MLPKIRTALPADAAAIAAIYNESIRTHEATMIEAIQTAASIQEQMRQFSDKETYLVMEAETNIIGWGVILRYSPRHGYRFACVTSIYLTLSETGKGHGSRLQQALLDQCRAFGYHHVVARIFASNTGSIRFHERHGYALVGIQREIGFKQGRWQDVAMMQCLL